MTLLGPVSSGDEPPTREAIYRQGYTHGAEAVVAAVAAYMPPGRMARLHEWAVGELRQWRFHLDAHQRIEPPHIRVD